jgi:hypothetical protein
MPDGKGDQLMTCDDLKTLSKKKSLSVYTLRNFVKKGMPHFRVGRKILVNPKEFDAWFEQHFRASAHADDTAIDRLVEDTLAELNMI